MMENQWCGQYLGGAIAFSMGIFLGCCWLGALEFIVAMRSPKNLGFSMVKIVEDRTNKWLSYEVVGFPNLSLCKVFKLPF